MSSIFFNSSVPWLNKIPSLISTSVDNFISKIPSFYKNKIVRFLELSRMLVGGLFLYVPFVFLFNRDLNLVENDLLNYNL